MGVDTEERLINLFWWVRWVPAFLLAVAVGAVFLLFAGTILIPLVLGFALTFVLEPVRDWFERRKLTRGASVTLTLLVATLVLILILAFLLPGLWIQIGGAINKLPIALEQASLRVEDGVGWTKAHLGPQGTERLELAIDELQQDPSRVISKLSGWLTRGVFGLVSLGASLVGLVIVPFFVYYLLRDLEHLRGAVLARVPERNRVAAALLQERLGGVLRSYVRGRIVEATLLTVIYSAILFFFGVPMWAAIGLLVGAFSLVPYMGVLTAYTLALTFSLFGGAGAGKLLALFLVITAVQFFDEYLLIPRLIGRRLKLHPLLVFVSLIISGSLFGLLGMILALPILGLAQVVIAFLDERYRQSSFYLAPAPYSSDRPAEPEPEE